MTISVILAVAAPASVIAELPEEYRLGIDDRVRVRIGQWSAVENAYENWEGLEGEYVVGPNGTLSITLAGSVPAEGLTVPEVAKEISLSVQRRIGMPTPPATAVEIAEFRPIYVVGAVSSPGEFRYRPQMTVLQVVGLAGGFLRSDTAFPGTLTVARDYEVLKLNRWSLIAELARLDAELASAQKIETTEELAEAPNAEELLRIEGEILAARNEAERSSKAAIDELRELLSAKIETLGKEIGLRNEQLKLSRDELERLQKAVKRGLTAASREAEFRRAVSDMEAQLLALEVATLTAEQQLNEATRAELNLVNERRRIVVTESQEARETLDQVEVKLQTARALVALSLGSKLALEQNNAKPIYRLMRRADGQATTLTVDEQHLMKPGDTLQVMIPDALPGSDDGQLADEIR